jgi:hypothetical protein
VQLSYEDIQAATSLDNDTAANAHQSPSFNLPSSEGYGVTTRTPTETISVDSSRVSELKSATQPDLIRDTCRESQPTPGEAHDEYLKLNGMIRRSTGTDIAVSRWQRNHHWRSGVRTGTTVWCRSPRPCLSLLSAAPVCFLRSFAAKPVFGAGLTGVLGDKAAVGASGWACDAFPLLESAVGRAELFGSAGLNSGYTLVSVVASQEITLGGFLPRVSSALQ